MHGAKVLRPAAVLTAALGVLKDEGLRGHLSCEQSCVLTSVLTARGRAHKEVLGDLQVARLEAELC